MKTTGNKVKSGNYAVGLKDGGYIDGAFGKVPKDYDILYALDADGNECIWEQHELTENVHSVHMKKVLGRIEEYEFK